jgi:hypothetical protein
MNGFWVGAITVLFVMLGVMFFVGVNRENLITELRDKNLVLSRRLELAKERGACAEEPEPSEPDEDLRPLDPEEL